MFKLNDRLDEQVEAHLHRLRRNGWLTFKGMDAVNILRKAMHVRIANPPVLVAHCHSQLAFAPHDYEHFVPRGFNFKAAENLATVEGTIGGKGEVYSLLYHPDRAADPSGLYLSSVSTLASAFPTEVFDAVQIPGMPF
jgi:hypothetical protein